jgi:hypothetical protein
MIGLSQKPTFAILDCLTGELREISQMPFEIGSGEAADLRIVDERVRERHCVVLEKKGKTYIARRDPQATVLLNGVERDSSVLTPATDYFVKIGPKFLAVRGSRDVAQWRDRVTINAWCLVDKATGFSDGPYPLHHLPRVMRQEQLDPDATIAHLAGLTVGLYLSQLLDEIGPQLESELEAEAGAAEPPPLPAEPGFAPQMEDELPDEGALTCPVCWLHFDKGDVMHVAVHEALKGDPIMGEDAMQRFKARSFNDRGQALDGMGLACTDIACPHCRRKLPPGFLDVPHHIFSIVGAPQAGKSYYLSVLIKALQDVLFKNFDVTLDDADPTANAMLNQMKTQLFSASDPESAYLIKTSFEGEMYELLRRQGRRVKLPKPFIFSLSSNRHAADTCSLVFYDNAGEHFQPGVDTTESPGAQHIASSAAIFFLFDPTYNAAFRRKLRGCSDDPQLTARGTHLDQQDIILSETKVRIRKLLGLGPRDRIATPLAVLLGKCDTWIDLVGREKLREPIRDGAIDLGAIDANSALIREFLVGICPAIVGGAESLSSEVKYFPVSPLGHSPVKFTDHNGAEKLGPDPMQLDPLFMEVPSLWALSKVAPSLVPAFT